MLNTDEVIKIAELSRLKLNNEELEKFHSQLNGVLDLFERIDNIDVSETEETSQVTGLQNITREDKVFYDDNARPSDTETLLKNIPISEGSKIIVPKVIEVKNDLT